MNPPTAKKKANGHKVPNVTTCPHAPECAAPKMHAELMTSIDELRMSVGVLLDSHTATVKRVNEVHEAFLEGVRTTQDCNEYILKELQDLREARG